MICLWSTYSSMFTSIFNCHSKTICKTDMVSRLEDDQMIDFQRVVFSHIAKGCVGFGCLRPGVGDQTGQPQEVGRDHLSRMIQDDPQRQRT